MKTQKTLITTLTLLALMGLQSVHAAYAGAGVGYLIDGQEELLTTHVGFQVAEKSSVSHNVEFEIAYADSSEMGVDIEILPIMVNYRIVNTKHSSYDLYFGVGVGLSIVDVDAFGYSDDDSVLTAQAMVGIDFKMSDKASIRLGYRYVYLDTVKVFDLEVRDPDDSVVEIGLVVKF